MQKTIKIKLHVTTERDDMRIVKALRRGLFVALDSSPYYIAPPDHVVIEDISIDDHDEESTGSNAELEMYKNACQRQRERITELKKEVENLTEMLQEVPEHPQWEEGGWEYRMMDMDAFDGSSGNMLFDMGEDGWELVSYSNIMESPMQKDYYFVRIIFKRERLAT